MIPKCNGLSSIWLNEWAAYDHFKATTVARAGPRDTLPRVLRFHHVNLGVPVGGAEAEEAFLQDVLGYRWVAPPPELAGRARWFESEDGRQIHLSEDPDHRPAARAHVAVEVGADLAGLEARLEQAGVEHTALDGNDLRVVFCQDPAGNRWELRGSV